MTQNMISVQMNQADIDAVMYALEDVKGGARTAIMRAINKAVTGVKTDMAKETSAILNLTQKRVKKDITVRKATKASLSGAVSSKGRPINLMQFGAKQNKKGVSVKVLKSGGRKTVKHAFIFVGQGNNELVGQRWAPDESKLFKKKKDPRIKYGALPEKYRIPEGGGIEGLTGPRVQDITGRPEVMEKIEVGAGERLEKELAHQVQRILDKHKGT